MKQSTNQIDRENKTQTIMPLEPRPSKSTGRTRMTGGLKTIEESYARKLVRFTVNVFSYAVAPSNSGEIRGDL